MKKQFDLNMQLHVIKKKSFITGFVVLMRGWLCDG